MEMDFTKVLKFRFNNHDYQLLLDDYGKYFFLRFTKDNKYSYITDKELIQLHNLFKNFPLVMNIKRNPQKQGKLRFIPKIIIGGIAFVLSSTLLLNILGNHQAEYLKNYYSNYTTQEEQVVQSQTPSIENDIAYVTEDKEEEPLEVETYLESEWLGYRYVYDSAYLGEILDYETVSPDQLFQAVEDNYNMSDSFKALLKEYITMFITKHPQADLRVLYENIKTLKVVECTKQELMINALSVDSEGCYIKTENTIYVPEGNEYVQRTWAYQVIMHEFSHMARNGVWDTAEEQIRVSPGLYTFSIVTDEALNSLFTVSLFDYEEKDIAYQLQSNYTKIIIDGATNYTLTDYINHSQSYFYNALDRQTGHVNYASVIYELIEAQYKDFHSESLEVDQSEYYPIYEYVSGFYFGKHITPDMTKDEINAAVDDLINQVIYDVPEEYNIDTDYFYTCAQTYCQENGIEYSVDLSR